MFDPLFGLPGLGLVLGSALALVLGGGAVGLASRGSKPDGQQPGSGPDNG